MKLLLLSALIAVALSQPLESLDDDHQWELFKVEHEKEYKSELEEQQRKKIFLNNVNFVREHNAKYKKGEVTFDVEINKFSDMTHKEFVETMNGLRVPAGYKSTGEEFAVDDYSNLPASVDWRKEGAVTPVKDQGTQCISSWAFSATGSLEGQAFLKTKKLVSLSEQNLVDCSTEEGNLGCQGGNMDLAFKYINNNKGIVTEASYPYKGKNLIDCSIKERDRGCHGGFMAFAFEYVKDNDGIDTKASYPYKGKNLIDYSNKERDRGCHGGFMAFAFEYVKDNNGIDTEASYPYKGKDQECSYKSSNKGATVTGYTNINPISDKTLQQAVAKVGPISVAIDASQPSFQHYKSGVYNEPNCSTIVFDQALLAVGYGTIKRGGPYWLVKNSWGTNWGMQGYIMMARNHHNMCGIASMASYPNV